MKFMLGLIAGVALGMTLPSTAQAPCDREPSTWQIAPPRLGHPGDLRYPLACVEVYGSLKCQ